MWFKNLTLFRLVEPLALTAEHWRRGSINVLFNPAPVFSPALPDGPRLWAARREIVCIP